MNLKLALFALAMLTATPVVAQDCAADQRLFDHELLAGDPVCIPKDPQNVLYAMVEGVDAVTLGADLAANNGYVASFANNVPSAPSILALKDKPDVGWIFMATPEQVLNINPDVIVSMNLVPDSNVWLKDIAPLLVVDYSNNPTWKQVQDFVAKLTGLDARADEAIALVDARIAKLKEDMEGRTPTFSLASAGETSSELRMLTENIFGAEILMAAGFKMAPGVLTPEQAIASGASGTAYDLAIENINDIDADYVFWLRGFENQVGKEQLADSPMWQRFAPFAEDRVIWTYGDGEQLVRGGAVNANLIIDDVYRNVLGKDPAEAGNPNPYADWLVAAE